MDLASSGRRVRRFVGLPRRAAGSVWAGANQGGRRAGPGGARRRSKYPRHAPRAGGHNSGRFWASAGRWGGGGARRRPPGPHRTRYERGEATPTPQLRQRRHRARPAPGPLRRCGNGAYPTTRRTRRSRRATSLSKGGPCSSDRRVRRVDLRDTMQTRRANLCGSRRDGPRVTRGVGRHTPAPAAATRAVSGPARGGGAGEGAARGRAGAEVAATPPRAPPTGPLRRCGNEPLRPMRPGVDLS